MEHPRAWVTRLSRIGIFGSKWPLLFALTAPWIQFSTGTIMWTRLGNTFQVTIDLVLCSLLWTSMQYGNPLSTHYHYHRKLGDWETLYGKKWSGKLRSQVNILTFTTLKQKWEWEQSTVERRTWGDHQQCMKQGQHRINSSWMLNEENKGTLCMDWILSLA